MTYCKQGDKPIITYSFNGKEKIYKSEFAPIEVLIKESPVEAEENFVNDGYFIRFYSTNNRRWLDVYVRNHKTKDNGHHDLRFRYELAWINCGETRFQSAVNYDPSTLTIDSTKKCISPQKNRCSIIVKYQDNTIFQDQGDCPIAANVQCGRCPDGSIECFKPTYPGYCCISCSEVKSEIRGIVNLMRNIKNG